MSNYSEEQKPSNKPSRMLTREERMGLPAIIPNRNDPQVYWGTEAFPSGGTQDQTMSLSDAAYTYALLTPQENLQLNSMMDRHFGVNRWQQSYVKNAWREAANISATALKNGSRVTIFDAFDSLASMDAGHTKAAGGSGGGAAGPTQSVNLTDPGQAKTLLNNSLSTYLGRKASQAEYDKFVFSLTQQEMANPNKSTVSGNTRITSGGFDPATFADEYAAGQQGSAEYQAATTYLDAFLGALKAPVGNL